jgi:hypothetical protein
VWKFIKYENGGKMQIEHGKKEKHEERRYKLETNKESLSWKDGRMEE